MSLRQAISLLVVVIIGCATIASAQEDVIQLDSGAIQGLIYDGYRAFRGIPYAAPPVGQWRWQPPQPVQSWSGVLPTVEDAAGCPQDCDFPPGTRACPNVTAESCLYLTLYTPRLSELQNNPAPIMVFFHGGEFINGHGGGSLWSGAQMASMTGTILVGVNYRLGALSWLHNGADITGNYGILDQIQALEWVQRNAKAIGGDPTRVTIFGQSAGAISSSILMSSPVARGRGLWSRVLMESQPYTIPIRDKTTMPALADEFAQFLGCALTDKQCLMSKNSSAIVAAQMAAQDTMKSDPKILNAFLCWTPIVDGSIVVGQPFTELVAGNYDYDIPVVMGTTRQEAFLFIYGAMKAPLPQWEYDAALIGILGLEVGVAAVIEYPVPSNETNDTRPQIATVATDYIFLCANRNVTRAMSTNTAVSNVWLYDFNHMCSFYQTAWYPNTQCYDAVCHGADLPFAFNSFEPFVNYTSDEAFLGANMVTYWTNFGHTGNPSQSGPWNKYPNLQNLVWPPYSTPTSGSISFETPQSKIIPFFQQTYCDFWDKEGYGY